MMSNASSAPPVFRSSEGEARFMAAYDAVLKEWPVEFQSLPAAKQQSAQMTKKRLQSSRRWGISEQSALSQTEASPMDVRPAESSEIDALASLWHAGWTDAHAAIVPAELKRVRTLESFRDRLRAGLANVRTLGDIGAPLGLCWVKDSELYQLYVAAHARGTGIASALIADAESLLLNAGFDVAWLACAIGNARAARFYEKSGWHRARTMTNVLDTPTGTFPLEVWRYEKSLRPGAGLPRC